MSSDYDFIDIFKMAVVLNPSAANITFRMIIPTVKPGRIAELPARVMNIDIIKC